MIYLLLPAYNEEDALPLLTAKIDRTMKRMSMPYRIVVVNDGSKDRTWEVLQELMAQFPTVAPVRNPGENGFGRAVVCGLDRSRGDAVVIMMADASDSPADAAKR